MLPKDYKQLCISPENDFLDPQNDQNACINLAERVDFWVKFRSTGNIFGLLELKIIEIFPPMAKCIGEKRFSLSKFLQVNSPHTTSPPHRKSFYRLCYRGGWFIFEINQNSMDISQCRASAGPQRRVSIMSSKEYKYSTLKISNNKNPR